MTRFLTCSFLFLSLHVSAQKDVVKRISVRTNLLNLFMKGPSVSVEKLLSNKIAAEVSFVKATNAKFFLTERYSYNGFLLRVKTYPGKAFQYNVPKLYTGVYGGTLKRSFYNTGFTSSNGYFGWNDRDFTASSLRAGASFGFGYISRSGFTVDYQNSLGYGKYTRIYKGTGSAGYLDMQMWVSIGYSF